MTEIYVNQSEHLSISFVSALNQRSDSQADSQVDSCEKILIMNKPEDSAAFSLSGEEYTKRLSSLNAFTRIMAGKLKRVSTSSRGETDPIQNHPSSIPSSGKTDRALSTRPKLQNRAGIPSSPGSLPRHSNTKRYARRKCQSYLQDREFSVLTFPIYEDAVATFTTTPSSRAKAQMKRMSSFYEPHMFSTNIVSSSIRSRASSITTPSGQAQSDSLSDITASLSAKRNQFLQSSRESALKRQRGFGHGNITSASLRKVESTKSPRKNQRLLMVETRSAECTVPEETLRRASLLSESRRKNLMSNLQSQANSPLAKEQNKHNTLKHTQHDFRSLRCVMSISVDGKIDINMQTKALCVVTEVVE